jgi:hypothetical protein
MAKINNLFVSTETQAPADIKDLRGINPKKVFISNDKDNLILNSVKKVYYNNILIWQNSNPFIFVEDINQIDTSTLESDTLIFVGFAPNNFEGTYDVMENEQDKPTQEGQMVVKNTTEGDDKE